MLCMLSTKGFSAATAAAAAARAEGHMLLLMPSIQVN
jgi:hypothetical protein